MIDKFEIAEKAGEIMFDCCYPDVKVIHQYEPNKLDFLHLEDKYVGDIKLRSKNTNAYDKEKGIMIEQTKIDHYLEAKEKYGVKYAVLIYFNADGVSVARIDKIADNPQIFEQYITSSWVEKTQGSSIRQNEVAYHIPSTHPIWKNTPYTEQEKQCYQQTMEWKKNEINKLKTNQYKSILNSIEEI